VFLERNILLALLGFLKTIKCLLIFLLLLFIFFKLVYVFLFEEVVLFK